MDGIRPVPGAGMNGLKLWMAIAFVLGLAACQTDTGGDERPGAAKDDAARAECVAAGGTPTMGLVGPACARPTPDAGQACTSSEQCTGFCLAETRSCSPVTPYFGCHELLENGEIVTICVD